MRSGTAVGPIAAAYALAAIGLNLHFGYTGLLNFGHVAFLMAGAYGTAITVDQGGPLWLGFLVGVAAAVVARPALRPPHAAAARRLPRDRHDRGGRGPAHRSCAPAARTRSPRGVFGIQRFAGRLLRRSTRSRDGSYGSGARFAYSERALWVMVVGLGTASRLAPCSSRSLMRSPWGRVLRADPRGRGRRPSLGKNVFAFKLQSLVLGGVIGAPRGDHAGDRPAVRATRTRYLPVVTFVDLRRRDPGRAGHHASARSSARSSTGSSSSSPTGSCARRSTRAGSRRASSSRPTSARSGSCSWACC